MGQNTGGQRRDLDQQADVAMVGFVGGTGGASVMMAELASGLAQRGLRSKIIIPAWQSTERFADECRDRGIVVERTPWLQEREPSGLAYVDATRLALHTRASIVHYHLSTNMMPARYVWPVRLLGARPAFATIHDPFDGPPPDSPAAVLWRRAAPQLFRAVVCVSRAQQERQLRYGLPPDCIRLVYNGVDTARFAAGDGARARARLGLDAAARLIVVVSRIAPQKRPLDAVMAFSRIANDLPHTQLVFLGEGALQDAVRDEAHRLGLGNRVHLPGHVFDTPDWLSAASAWFLPTESEGFSVAVLEALAAGCPIVTTDCPGNVEVLEHGENALLTRVGDVGSMAEALRRVMNDADLRQRLQAAGAPTAARFSISHTVDAYAALYAATRRPHCAPGTAASESAHVARASRASVPRAREGAR